MYLQPASTSSEIICRWIVTMCSTKIVEAFIHAHRGFPLEALRHAIWTDKRHFHWFVCDILGEAKLIQRNIFNERQPLDGGPPGNNRRALLVEILLRPFERVLVELPLFVVCADVLGYVETCNRFGKAFLKTVSPKLTVRHHWKPVSFLSSDHFANRFVLGLAEFVVAEPFSVVAVERFLQFGGSNEAADMVNPKSLQIFHSRCIHYLASV